LPDVKTAVIRSRTVGKNLAAVAACVLHHRWRPILSNGRTARPVEID